MTVKYDSEGTFGAPQLSEGDFILEINPLCSNPFTKEIWVVTGIYKRRIEIKNDGKTYIDYKIYVAKTGSGALSRELDFSYKKLLSDEVQRIYEIRSELDNEFTKIYKRK